MTIITEFALRLSGKFTTSVINYKYNPALIGDFAPNQNVIDTSIPSLPALVTINSQGYRGPLVGIPKPVGITRLLALGDSFTQGMHVQDLKTWPAQLEQDLNSISYTKLFEVINAGKTGYTATDEIAYYHEKGYRFDPDIIFLEFTVENDIADLGSSLPSREYSKQLSFWESNSFWGPWVRRVRQTALFNILYAAKINLEGRLHKNIGPIGLAQILNTVNGSDVFLDNPPKQVQDLWNKYFKIVKNFHQELAVQGKQLIILIIPAVSQIQGNNSLVPQQKISDFASREKIQLIDTTAAFKKINEQGKNLYLTPLDSHPSPIGYAQVAQTIANIFLQSKILQ